MDKLFFLLLIIEGIVSVICFFTFGLDKLLACKGKRRIRERTLHLWIWLFGAPGGFLGMCVFRHKTLHASFWFSAAGGLVVQLLLLFGAAFLAYS